MGLLSFLKNLIVSEPITINGDKWVYRISEGEYEWAASFHALKRGFPFQIFAYKMRSPEFGERYVFKIYPEGCVESACAIFLQTEATDRDVLDYMKYVAENAYLLKTDPEEFFDRLSWKDMYEISPRELEERNYEEIKPNRRLAKRLARFVRRKGGSS